jgi:hypothetical protein
MKKQYSTLSTLKLTIALPVLAFLFSAFAFTPEQDIDQSYIEKNEFTGDTDTIKRVSVTVGYLKLLEGEYVSTNEPTVRKIKFKEEDGELFGNDNGYRYILIPVGDGKFINPDDGASLIFDTKDKKAITLLLFGTIKLKKVK